MHVVDLPEWFVAIVQTMYNGAKSKGRVNDSYSHEFNPLSTNPTQWSNTLQQLVDNLPKNCLSVFDYFVGLALKGSKLKLVYMKALFVHGFSLQFWKHCLQNFVQVVFENFFILTILC